MQCRMVLPEFLHPGLVGGDGGAFDAHPLPLDRIGGVDGHLIGGGIPVLDTQIVVFKIDIQIWQDQPLLDERPDDPRHLVAVELDNLARNLNPAHGHPFADSRWHQI